MTISKRLKKSALGERLVRRPPLVYWHSRRTLALRNSLPLDARKAASNKRLREILAVARRAPHYSGEAYAGDFSTWPYLTKEQLRDNAAAFNLPTRLPAASASTSGSTGVPLELRRSWPSVVAEQAAIDGFVAPAGVDFASARIALLRGETVKDPTDMTPPFWFTYAGGRRFAMSSLHVSRKTIKAYLEALREFDPEVIWAYPSSLEPLVALVEDDKVALHSLKLILTSSDVLKTSGRIRIEQLFGVPVYDYYGQAERVNLAVSTERDEYYFVPTYGRNELIFSHSDDDNDYYEIVGTSLLNTAQPLVRYRTGDYALLPKNLSADQIEEICFGVRPFRGISGRFNDYIVTPDGGHLVSLALICSTVPHLAQFQLVQTALNHVRMLVVPASNFRREDEEQLVRQARQRIPRSMEIVVDQVEQVRRTKLGKVPFIIRENGI